MTIIGLTNIHIIQGIGYSRWVLIQDRMDFPANDDSDMADIAGAWL